MVEWRPTLWESKIATDEQIVSVEQIIGVKFPKDYYDIVKANQGRSPSPSVFTFFDPIKDVDSANNMGFLFHFEIEESVAQFNILRVYERYKPFLPSPIVVPFSQDRDENLICFDYRVVEMGASSEPCIVYINSIHNGGSNISSSSTSQSASDYIPIWLASSFTGLLERLITNEEYLEINKEDDEFVAFEDDVDSEESEEGDEGEEEEEQVQDSEDEDNRDCIDEAEENKKRKR
eukprot:TRINITY_DN1744_c0_g2_i1.p1 TRINITY_DN1744_c0_g2~~TRINITY_DN1744_c0_g2_i1.p1  ORF type:complete len:234 (+),score=51.07 TRINITY_DN1744_c0_g2_i1:77-778(+)